MKTQSAGSSFEWFEAFPPNRKMLENADFSIFLMVINLSYRGKSKGSYGNQRRSRFGSGKFGKGRAETKIARSMFEKKSEQSQVQDLIRMDQE